MSETPYLDKILRLAHAYDRVEHGKLEHVSEYAPSLGDHVRISSGYHEGLEGYVTKVTDGGVHLVDNPDAPRWKWHPNPVKHGYYAPTGKPSKEIPPEPELEKPLQSGDKVMSGLHQGQISQIGRRHGIDMALVHVPVSDFQNKYGGEGYAPHWIPLDQLKRVK